MEVAPGSGLLLKLRRSMKRQELSKYFKPLHESHEIGAIILTVVFSIFNFQGALFRSCGFNYNRMLMTTKFVAPASNHSLNFRLMYSSIHLASPVRWQIRISDLTSKRQLLIVLRKCSVSPASFPSSVNSSSILPKIQAKNLVSLIPLIQLVSNSSCLCLQNTSRIYFEIHSKYIRSHLSISTLLQLALPLVWIIVRAC